MPNSLRRPAESRVYKITFEICDFAEKSIHCPDYLEIDRQCN